MPERKYKRLLFALAAVSVGLETADTSTNTHRTGFAAVLRFSSFFGKACYCVRRTAECGSCSRRGFSTNSCSDGLRCSSTLAKQSEPTARCSSFALCTMRALLLREPVRALREIAGVRNLLEALISLDDLPLQLCQAFGRGTTFLSESKLLPRCLVVTLGCGVERPLGGGVLPNRSKDLKKPET